MAERDARRAGLIGPAMATLVEELAARLRAGLPIEAANAELALLDDERGGVWLDDAGEVRVGLRLRQWDAAAGRAPKDGVWLEAGVRLVPAAFVRERERERVLAYAAGWVRALRERFEGGRVPLGCGVDALAEPALLEARALTTEEDFRRAALARG